MKISYLDINTGNINKDGGFFSYLSSATGIISSVIGNIGSAEIIKYLNLYNNNINLQDLDEIYYNLYPAQFIGYTKITIEQANISYNKIRTLITSDQFKNLNKKLIEINNNLSLIFKKLVDEVNIYKEIWENLKEIYKAYYEYYKRIIEQNNNIIIKFFNKFEKINKNIENCDSYIDTETDPEKYIESEMKFKTKLSEWLVSLGNGKELSNDFKKLLQKYSIILNLDLDLDLSLDIIQIYDKIYLKINNTKEDKLAELLIKFCNYNKFYNYLNQYTPGNNLEKNIIFTKINNNNFDLSKYDFINKIINEKYSESSIQYNQLKKLINTKSDFLNIQKVYELIKSVFQSYLEFGISFINGSVFQSSIFNESDIDQLYKGNLIDSTNLKKQIYEKSIEYINEDYFKDLEGYELFVKIGLLAKKIKDDEQSRKKYYPKILKFLSTYDKNVKQKNLYEILNKIADTNDKKSLDQLIIWINNLEFLYKIDYEKKQQYDSLKTGNITENLKLFTADIKTNIYFNIIKMREKIENVILEKINNSNFPNDNISFEVLVKKYIEILTDISEYDFIIKQLERTDNFNQKFVILYQLLSNPVIIAEDSELNKNLICKYVNAYRNEKIDDQIINNNITNFLINQNENSDFDNYINYNKSLNHKFNYNIKNKHFYLNILQLITKINDAKYLDTEKMIEDIRIHYNYNNEVIEYIKKTLFTNEDISVNNLNTNIFKDECVINNIKNKVLSGIKIFIYIYDCTKLSKDYTNNVNNDFIKIHSYLIKNTTEKNSIKLIKLKKLSNILEKLKIGIATPEDIRIIKKIYNLKKVKDIKTDINNLLDTKQIESYYTLLYLSPENIKTDFMSLLQEYISANNPLANIYDILGLYNKIKNIGSKFNLEDFELFINKKLSEDFKNKYWQIYMYFNFDCRIINKIDLIKIMTSLEDGNCNIKNLETLQKIIEYNQHNLSCLSKELNPKLLYFKNKNQNLKDISKNELLQKQLYNILEESATNNNTALNLIQFSKEQNNVSFLRKENINIKDEKIDKIIFMFQVFSNYNTDISSLALNLLNEGDADEIQINNIISNINKSDKFIKNNNRIIIFLNDNIKNPNQILEYDKQQELYSILDELSDKSTYLTDIIVESIDQVKDVLTTSVENKIKSVMIENGLGYITPTNLFETVSDIVQVAKPLILTAGIGYATSYAFRNIDKIFKTDKNNTNKQDYLIRLEDYNKYKKSLILAFGTGLTLYNSQELFSKLYKLINKYILVKTNESNLPEPSDSYLVPIIGSIITGALSMYNLKGGNLSGGNLSGGNLIEDLINYILKMIDKYFGFNGNKPIEKLETKKTIENVYVYLKEKFNDNIFENIELNEYPNQQKILDMLNNKYKQFFNLTFKNNPYVNLSKVEKKKIKKIIAKIVSIEINLFKDINQFTFVSALKKFLE